MALSIVNRPTFYPLTVDEAKARLRITSSDEDEVILRMIAGATQWCERILGWRLCEQTWKIELDDFPTKIRIPYPPLQSITHIKYYDENNIQQTLSSSEYYVDSSSYPGRIEYVTSWPSYYDKPNTIEIQFVCGFENQEDIPDDIIDALYLRLADLDQVRQNTLVGVASVSQNSETSRVILNQHKLFNEPCI